MQQVQPAVMDAAPIVREAELLLNNPLEIRVFDPVTGDAVYWSVNPSQWANWITAAPNPDSPIGLSLDVNAAQLESYLTQQASQSFDASRTIDVNAGIQSIRQALAAGRPQDGFVQVQHRERTHIVQAGETITSIAWDYGIPYLYIMDANGGIQDVSVGQSITIPPADIFLDAPVNPNKRIVVDIGEQRTRVYENGQLLYDWVSSTGIASSPTWTGVYQVLSHEPNAYAANWNLYMPNFIGIYQPVPGAEFTNGFHGFPTRGGGQLLWENNLGTRVTYGCVLLSNQHVQILYDWAEEGVVVEIRA
jgi:lipoprotein-anchoring transpeptidase ErfK/SrfK